ncbi:multiple cyclophane-containing RiPP AmcA [Actinophytocola sp.]|uniref:multiple cyclophane-containing RiPP AmcA n=1 Tax=Actinophytocola sp. TaxID=1872138 RepID=UPI003C77BBED
MTILEQIVRTVSQGNGAWAQFVAAHAPTSAAICGVDWGRKGGSWAKEGEFAKK